MVTPYGLDVIRQVDGGRASVIGPPERSHAGNLILRVGHLVNGGRGGWEATEHVVLTPAEARHFLRKCSLLVPTTADEADEALRADTPAREAEEVIGHPVDGRRSMRGAWGACMSVDETPAELVRAAMSPPNCTCAVGYNGGDLLDHTRGCEWAKVHARVDEAAQALARFDASLIDRLDEFARKHHDADVCIRHSANDDPEVRWSIEIVWGREADDSPMAAAAAYGIADTVKEALTQALDEAGA